MTRKDYKIIAEAIRCAKGKVANFHFHAPSAYTAFSFLERELVDVLSKDNPRFNSALFHDACKLEEEGK